MPSSSRPASSPGAAGRGRHGAARRAAGDGLGRPAPHDADRRRGLGAGRHRHHRLRRGQLRQRPPRRSGARDEPDPAHEPAGLQPRHRCPDRVLGPGGERPRPQPRVVARRQPRSTSPASSPRSRAARATGSRPSTPPPAARRAPGRPTSTARSTASSPRTPPSTSAASSAASTASRAPGWRRSARPTAARSRSTPMLAGGYGVRSRRRLARRDQGRHRRVVHRTNGSTNPGRGMAALDASTGASLPWAVNSLIRNAGTNAAMYSLASDGDSVYGTGYDYYGTGRGRLRGRRSGRTGATATWSGWRTATATRTPSSPSATRSTSPATRTTAATSAASRRRARTGSSTTRWRSPRPPSGSSSPLTRWATTATPGSRLRRCCNWFPDVNEGTLHRPDPGPVERQASGDYVLYGGEFPAVNGERQQGLVRFAKSTIAPNKRGSADQGGSWALDAQSLRAGEVRVAGRRTTTGTTRSCTTRSSVRTGARPRRSGDRPVVDLLEPPPMRTSTRGRRGTDLQLPDQGDRPFGNWTWTDWTPVTVDVHRRPRRYVNAVLRRRRPELLAAG